MIAIAVQKDFEDMISTYCRYLFVSGAKLTRVVSLTAAVSFGGSLSVCFSAEIRFQRIADRTTPIPGGTGNFVFPDTFRSPTLHNGNVVFAGNGQDFQTGVYTTTEWGLRIVADTHTINPASSTNFDRVNYLPDPPHIVGERISFYGQSRSDPSRPTSNGPQGIFVEQRGSLSTIADTNTTIPGKSTTFTRLRDTNMSSTGSVVFLGDDVSDNPNSLITGIYKHQNGSLSRIAEAGDTMPKYGVPFRGFSNLSIEGEEVVFRGFNRFNLNPNEAGLYSSVGGELSVIADTLTEVPGVSNVFFNGLLSPSVSEYGITFQGTATDRRDGIYLSKDGMLEALVDSRDFDSDFDLGFHAYDGRRLLFTEGTTNKIYMAESGEVSLLFDGTAMLNGRVPDRFYFDVNSFHNNELAVKVRFGVGDYGIYKGVIVPEPSGGIAVLAGFIFLGSLNRRKRDGHGR